MPRSFLAAHTETGQFSPYCHGKSGFRECLGPCGTVPGGTHPGECHVPPNLPGCCPGGRTGSGCAGRGAEAFQRLPARISWVPAVFPALPEVSLLLSLLKFSLYFPPKKEILFDKFLPAGARVSCFLKGFGDFHVWVIWDAQETLQPC